MQPTKVMIVDDHTLFRQGVRAAVERDGDFQVVGEAADGREALAKARELHPDLVLMDIGMPGLDGLEAVREIKGELPMVKVIMLTVHDDESSLLDAIKGGAEGFLSKSVRAEALRASLRGAVKGEAAILGRMSACLLKELARLAQIEASLYDGQLTYRERQVLAKLREGLSNGQIADALCVSENTVKAHLGHIFKKLHVHNRSEAAAHARRLGLGRDQATGQTYSN
jgi:two-component system nitrate/nitrite response regulator NarL